MIPLAAFRRVVRTEIEVLAVDRDSSEVLGFVTAIIGNPNRMRLHGRLQARRLYRYNLISGVRAVLTSAADYVTRKYYTTCEKSG